MTNFITVPEFDSDMAHLLKKYQSLEKDLERWKSALRVTNPKLLPGVVRISDLGYKVIDPIYKVKHFRCESLKGKGSRSGIRIIFRHGESTNEVTFVEIYHKNQQANPDKNRIKKYFEAS